MLKKMNRYFIVAILSLVYLVTPAFVKPSYSLECKPGFTYSNQQELEQIKALCEQKVLDLKNKGNTLTSQIQYMDTQIYLTGLKIKDTEQKIQDAQKEIETLTSRIDGLDNSLNYLSKLLINRVVSGYKTQQVSLFNLFFDSGNADDFLNKIKYQKTARENTQNLLVQVQESKLNAEEQKSTREKKKIELAKLSDMLNEQKKSIDSQKDDKQKLLDVTRSDESTYQRLVDEAQKQLGAFKSFVKTAGGGVTSFGTGSDGWYYTQRDERWAGKTIGYSSDTVMEVGCLLTDIAMLMKKDGVDWTPLTVASNTSFFFSNTAYMLYPGRFSWPNGKSYVNIATSAIDDNIKAGRPVIVGLNTGAYGTHYVILKAIDGGSYIMHDPYYGPDKKFSDYYSKGLIFIAAVFQ